MADTKSEEKPIEWSRYDTGDSLNVIYLSEYIPDLPNEIEYMFGSKTAWVKGKLYRFTVVDVESYETSWSDIPWDEMQDKLEDAQSGCKSPSRTCKYIKVEKISPDEYGKQLYETLDTQKYKSDCLNEGMEILYDKHGWLRYLLNHNTQCAYEIAHVVDDWFFRGLSFINTSENLSSDIDWDSIKSEDKTIIEERHSIYLKRNRYSHEEEIKIVEAYENTDYYILDHAIFNKSYCDAKSIVIDNFKNGVAQFSFLVPSRKLMLRKRTLRLYGFINGQAKVVVKFRQIKDDSELEAMRMMAEEKEQGKGGGE